MTLTDRNPLEYEEIFEDFDLAIFIRITLHKKIYLNISFISTIKNMKREFIRNEQLKKKMSITETSPYSELNLMANMFIVSINLNYYLLFSTSPVSVILSPRVTYFF